MSRDPGISPTSGVCETFRRHGEPYRAWIRSVIRSWPRANPCPVRPRPHSRSRARARRAGRARALPAPRRPARPRRRLPRRNTCQPGALRRGDGRRPAARRGIARRHARAVARRRYRSRGGEPLRWRGIGRGAGRTARELQPLVDGDRAPALSSQGFKILLDLVATSRGSLRIAELPYVFRERQHGESKLDARIVLDVIALIVAKLSNDAISFLFLMFFFGWLT